MPPLHPGTDCLITSSKGNIVTHPGSEPPPVPEGYEGYTPPVPPPAPGAPYPQAPQPPHQGQPQSYPPPHAAQYQPPYPDQSHQQAPSAPYGPPQPPQQYQPAPGAQYQPPYPGQQYQGYPPAPNGQYPPAPEAYGYAQPKSKLTAGLLGIFLGGFGVHRFYLGYAKIGIFQILATLLFSALSFPIGAVWGLVEGIMILAGSDYFRTDAKGIPLRG